MRESGVRKHLHKRVKDLGGEYRAAKWIGRDHCPDDLVLLPGRAIWIEGKAPGKAAREGQLREHERMRAAGCEVVVLDTIEKIDEYLPLKDMNATVPTKT